MVVLPQSDRGRSGAVDVDDAGHVIGFPKACPGGRHSPGLINAGVYMLRRVVRYLIPPGRAVSLEGEVFPMLIHRRGTLFAWEVDARFVDIGTPEATMPHRHSSEIGGAGMGGARRKAPVG